MTYLARIVHRHLWECQTWQAAKREVVGLSRMLKAVGVVVTEEERRQYTVEVWEKILVEVWQKVPQ